MFLMCNVILSCVSPAFPTYANTKYRIVDIYKRRQNKMERRVSLFMPVVSSDSRVPVTHKKGPLKIKNNAVLRARLYGRFLLVITRVLLSRLVHSGRNNARANGKHVSLYMEWATFNAATRTTCRQQDFPRDFLYFLRPFTYDAFAKIAQ